MVDKARSGSDYDRMQRKVSKLVHPRFMSMSLLSGSLNHLLLCSMHHLSYVFFSNTSRVQQLTGINVSSNKFLVSSISHHDKVNRMMLYTEYAVLVVCGVRQVINNKVYRQYTRVTVCHGSPGTGLSHVSLSVE